MNTYEKRVIEFLEKNACSIFMLIATLLSILVRWYGMDMMSGDYNTFLAGWYDEIKNNGGLNALSQQVGDYNIAYQFIISLFTYTPIYPLHAYKIFSIIFDYSLAFGTACLVVSLKHKNFEMKTFVLAYSAVLFLPTVFINSAYWAQCDCIYVSFIVWALYFLRKEKFTLAFILFGVSLAFKLQMVFIVPFILYYYVSTKKFSIVKLLWIPVMLFISSLPAVFNGRPVTTFIDIYLDQTDRYPSMNMNFANYWWVSGGHYEYLKMPAIFMTLILFGAAMILIVKLKVDVNNNRLFLLIASWGVWTCINFLPGMHDRYGYLLDILFFALVFVDYRKYLKFFVFTYMISVILYGRFLFNTNMDLTIPAFSFVAMYVYFSYVVYEECRNAPKASSIAAPAISEEDN